jgi:outer membrane protein TolC
MGGQRKGYTQRSRAGIAVATEEINRTGLKIVHDVRRMYYAALLSREVTQIARDTLSRLEATLSITEGIYQRGSELVDRTDYLRNLVVVHLARSAVAQMEANEKMSMAALANVMGLQWDDQLELLETEIPVVRNEFPPQFLIDNAYQFNPDWKQIGYAMDAAEGEIKVAKGKGRPLVALFGILTTQYNDSFGSGLDTQENQYTSTVGVGVEVPLFTGFRTRNEIREARFKLEQFKHQKILLRDGLAVQIYALVMKTDGAWSQIGHSGDAIAAAKEERELTVESYRYEIAETDDVLRSHINEAFINAQYLKSRYDHASGMADMELVIGTEIASQLDGTGLGYGVD